MGFPGGSDSKESACSAGDLGLIPGLGRFPEEGHGNQAKTNYLSEGQCSSQENNLFFLGKKMIDKNINFISVWKIGSLLLSFSYTLKPLLLLFSCLTRV